MSQINVAALANLKKERFWPSALFHGRKDFFQLLSDAFPVGTSHTSLRGRGKKHEMRALLVCLDKLLTSKYQLRPERTNRLGLLRLDECCRIRVRDDSLTISTNPSESGAQGGYLSRKSRAKRLA